MKMNITLMMNTRNYKGFSNSTAQIMIGSIKDGLDR